jgi:hypothetical protein
MPSPFPGMNPYIEQDDAWHDFYERFLPLIAERIGTQVQPNYIVKIDEHVYIHQIPQEPRRFLGRADLSVTSTEHPVRDRAAAGVIEAPVHVQLPSVDVERLAFVEIRARRSRELVTVIELLSPSNKRPGPNRDQYLSQRGQILASSAHFVEIDLLRGGAPMPLVDRPVCDYAVLVSRYEERPRAGLWPIGLRDRLPVIPVPLRSPDPDAQLDLQVVLDHIYDTGGYAYYIFDDEPKPPLRSDDAAWARTFIPPAP